MRDDGAPSGVRRAQHHRARLREPGELGGDHVGEPGGELRERRRCEIGLEQAPLVVGGAHVGEVAGSLLGHDTTVAASTTGRRPVGRRRRQRVAIGSHDVGRPPRFRTRCHGEPDVCQDGPTSRAPHPVLAAQAGAPGSARQLDRRERPPAYPRCLDRSPSRPRDTGAQHMSDFVPGLEGVIAFETEIAEPDKDGGALRYRGVDIEDLVGRVSYGDVWGLLVDNEFNPGLPPRRAVPDPGPLRRRPRRRAVGDRDARARRGACEPLLDIDDDDRARQPRPRVGHGDVVRRAVALAASASRWCRRPQIDKAHTVVERFMRRWRGEPDPAHVAGRRRLLRRPPPSTA